MLLVTLFAPASQLSAAAALAALYYFVLAHQVTYKHVSFACFCAYRQTSNFMPGSLDEHKL